MTRYVCFFLTWVVLLFPAGQSKAQPDLSDVKVITSFYEPYSYLDGDGVQGEAVNQARKVLAELNFYPQIKIFPWARAYNTALNSPNTLIFSMARTPERENLFHWVGEIVGFNVFLFKKKGRDDIEINQLEDANKFRVGALFKDVKGEYLSRNGIDVVSLNDEEAGIKMLLANRIDLLPTDIVSMKHRLKKNGLAEDALTEAFHIKEISRPLYMALSKKTSPEIVEAFRAAYKRAFP